MPSAAPTASWRSPTDHARRTFSRPFGTSATRSRLPRWAASAGPRRSPPAWPTWPPRTPRSSPGWSIHSAAAWSGHSHCSRAPSAAGRSTGTNGPSAVERGSGRGGRALPLTAVTPLRLQSLYADRLAAGCSATSVRHPHRFLHRVFGDAMRWSVVPDKPGGARHAPTCGAPPHPPRSPRTRSARCWPACAGTGSRLAASALAAHRRRQDAERAAGGRCPVRTSCRAASTRCWRDDGRPDGHRTMTVPLIIAPWMAQA